MNNGIIETAALSPISVRVGDPEYNVDRMLELASEISGQNRAGKRNTRIAVFPELAITGYNCGELFNQTALLDGAKKALCRFLKDSASEYSPLFIVGMPLRKDNQLFNCAVIIHNGRVLGVVPKTYLPNYSVLYEARYFSPSFNRLDDELSLFGEIVPFTPNLLFEDKTSGAIVAAELCEDLWMPLPPSAYHCLHGSNIVANLSSSNQTCGKTAYREDLLKIHSSICACGYIYSCATAAETTRDSVFAGHNIIADNGQIVAETQFMKNGNFTFGEIDIEKAGSDRIKRGSYMALPDRLEYRKIYYETFEPKTNKFISNREFSLLPFVPKSDDEATEILGLMATGLAQRLQIKEDSSVLIEADESSGSLLAIFAAVEAFKLKSCASERIIVTGSEKIKQLANYLCITYLQTAQTSNAIRLETSNMTDIAIYGSSHDNSAYPLNASVPKTAVGQIVRYYTSKQENVFQNIVSTICDSFDYSCPHVIYDFILYYMLACGFSPKKIYDLYMTSMTLNAKRTGIKAQFSPKRVLEEMNFFYTCFFSPEVRRNPMPDCVKIFDASLSAKDWRMPDHAPADAWLSFLRE